MKIPVLLHRVNSVRVRHVIRTVAGGSQKQKSQSSDALDNFPGSVFTPAMQHRVSKYKTRICKLQIARACQLQSNLSVLTGVSRVIITVGRYSISAHTTIVPA